jgi:hypothetical protein
VLSLNNADQEPEDLADHLAAYKKAHCNKFAGSTSQASKMKQIVLTATLTLIH